ncbi:sterile alpha motif domain-containing 3-like protein [Labeo rohita]|uniref:Sterile alpha motif domain-containing 3-like protein n=2 Tax=Labeo rohita TaxID=84645 RepID=A0A498MYE7_LABRO|nr:sterile alpha motif domain-containing 3-like protein [Labeo rohita]
MILTQKITPVTAPPGDFDHKDLHKSQWKQVQCLAESFWKRWRQEYLVTLQKRHKWTDDKPNIQVDDVVLMKDSQAKRNDWPIGLVVKTLPSKDNKVRKLLPVDMAPSAKLQIIFGEDVVRKLLLPAGIPSTLQDLNDVLRETFDITGPFTVMYQDMDFDDESGPSYRSKPWPFKFEIPDFSYDIDLALEAGKQAYENDGTLLNNPSVTSSILEKLAETIFGFSAYPTGVQILAVAEALVEKYPCLKEPGSFNGLYGWQQRIKYKMGNYRAKLRGRQLAIPELEIKEEFKRITTIHLEPTFLSRLDRYTTKLLEIFRRKGGTAGTKIKPMLDSLNEHHVDGRRDIIIRCLVEYLGESGEELIKDYQDVSQEALKEDCSNHMMKIIVIHPNVAQENQDPVNVSVIIEGTEILEDCGSVTNACLLLMGVIYAVNLTYVLSYPNGRLDLDVRLLFLMASLEVQRVHWGVKGNLQESESYTASDLPLVIYLIIWQSYVL